MKRFLVPVAVAFLLAGPALIPSAALAAPATSVPAAASWRNVATSSDRKRIHDWRKAWSRALEEARIANSADLAKEGALLDPDAATAGAAPPPGDYRCRTIKLGSPGRDMLDYVAYSSFTCRIGPADASGTMIFTKTNGSQRPIGRLFPDGARRMIFLGTLQLADEQGVLRYGHDEERNMAGVIERIGPRRWRLVLPYPHFESLVDVIELIPVS